MITTILTANADEGARKRDTVTTPTVNQMSNRSPSSITTIGRIFLVSVLGLFLEMMVIRWVSTEIRIFAYLQNTLLVICFLGLGIGLLTARQGGDFRKVLIPFGLLVILLSWPASRQALANISSMLSVLDDFLIWAPGLIAEPGMKALMLLIGLASAALIMFLLLELFVPIGRVLGELMDSYQNAIAAYTVNILGSLAGVWLFVVLSQFYLPPIAWSLVAALLLLPLLVKRGTNLYASLALLAIPVAVSWIAGLDSDALRIVWSPYQKLVIKPSGSEHDIGDYIITVNNTGYQVINDLSASHVASNPQRFPTEMVGLSQYDIPLLLHPNPRRYLVVGAGTGNDVAAGLRRGVEQITAVEIDPAIIELGREWHPEMPYAASAVALVNDDARSYFAASADRFDVISFGLLDSHTGLAMTNARLDHYVYTRESIARARSLLADGGVIVLSFEAAKPYIADRMARLLREEFGQDPIAFRVPPTEFGWGGVLFVTGSLQTAQSQISRNPRLADLITRSQRQFPLKLTYTTPVVTDDWPYVYLEFPRIPALYFLLTVPMVLLVILSYRRWDISQLGSSWDRSHWHFFLLGAAFLLLEVQNISKASVVLGSTWQVNAVVVSGVLGMALAANLLAYRFPRIPMKTVFVALIGLCIGLYFVDIARFAAMPLAARALVVGFLTGLPMLLSGIAFVRSFAESNRKDTALGANMIGSLAGALLQSVSFVTGIQALLLVVAAFYLLAFVTRPRAA